MFSKSCQLVLAALALGSTLFLTSVHGRPPQGGRRLAQQSRRLAIAQNPDSVSIQPSSTNRPGRQTVTVTVDKSRVRVGEMVRIRLTTSSLPNHSNRNVTVDFGDGTRIETRQNEVTHRYDATGHYKVYASVADAETGQKGDTSRPVPRVTLVIIPTRAVANTQVNFKAQLSSNYPGIKYRFVFGDGSQTDWQDGSVTSHTYPSGGTYAAYVDLGLGDRGVFRQAGGSVRQSIVISDLNKPPEPIDPRTQRKDPPLPGPVRLTANPTPVQTGKPVIFNAQASSTNPNVRYRFRFGDGSASNWQESSQSTHSYAASGKYSASVSLGLSTNGTIRSLSQDRQRVEVTKTPSIDVDFAATPMPVEKGQPVTFNAQVKSGESNLRYRFVFGDGPSASEWQTASQAAHSYADSGEYPAHVEIGRLISGGVVPIGTSSTKMISVTSTAVATASPKPTQTSSPGASPSSSNPNGVTPLGPVSSPSNTPSSGPPAGLPDNWWVYLLIALLLLFVAYQFYKALFLPRTTFHANRDIGSSELDAGAKGLSINSEVLLRRNVSEGQYGIHTAEPNIVRSVRRENV